MTRKLVERPYVEPLLLDVERLLLQLAGFGGGIVGGAGALQRNQGVFHFQADLVFQLFVRTCVCRSCSSSRARSACAIRLRMGRVRLMPML